VPSTSQTTISEPQALLGLLESQLASFLVVMAAELKADLSKRALPEKWSAHNQLAHLTRYHEIFLERMARILREANPSLTRYRAEEDPDWHKWQELPTAEVLGQLRVLRAQLIDQVRRLSGEDFARTGVHPKFGNLTLKQWLEFFLVHEGHHLYALFQLLRSEPLGN
jgi:hypothetical protein